MYNDIDFSHKSCADVGIELKYLSAARFTRAVLITSSPNERDERCRTTTALLWVDVYLSINRPIFYNNGRCRSANRDFDD